MSSYLASNYNNNLYIIRNVFRFHKDKVYIKRDIKDRDFDDYEERKLVFICFIYRV